MIECLSIDCQHHAGRLARIGIIRRHGPMVGDGKLEKAEIEAVGSTDVHIVGPEAFLTAVAGKFVDADKQRVGPGSYLEPIAQMVTVPMGQDNEVGSQLIRGDRRGWIVIQKCINQQNQSVIGGNLEGRMGKISEFHSNLHIIRVPDLTLST